MDVESKKGGGLVSVLYPLPPSPPPTKPHGMRPTVYALTCLPSIDLERSQYVCIYAAICSTSESCDIIHCC